MSAPTDMLGNLRYTSAISYSQKFFYLLCFEIIFQHHSLLEPSSHSRLHNLHRDCKIQDTLRSSVFEENKSNSRGTSFTFTRQIMYNIFDSNCPFTSRWKGGKTLHFYSQSNRTAASRNLRCRVLENSIFVFTTARLSLSLARSLSLSHSDSLECS
jgi:hypothetical protein